MLKPVRPYEPLPSELKLGDIVQACSTLIYSVLKTLNVAETKKQCVRDCLDYYDSCTENHMNDFLWKSYVAWLECRGYIQQINPIVIDLAKDYTG